MTQGALELKDINNWMVYDHGGSYLEIVNAKLSSKGKGIATESGVMTIKRVILDGASDSNGIVAIRGGIIKFQDFLGQSTINGSTPYRCSIGGAVYADQKPLGSATSPGGCLQIGGITIN